MEPKLAVRMLTTASIRVNLSVELSRISGAKNSLHEVRNANSPTVIRPGRTAGSMIAVSAPKLLQPSISAASSSSSGIGLERVAHHEDARTAAGT